MTSQNVYVDIVQTIDFNTEVGKVGILGFHTPSTSIIQSVASGLLDNFRKISFTSMDFALACVSQLPVDPLGVGYEAGKVAPQDVVNPVLFKACTGESLNALLNSMYDPVASLDSTSFTRQDILNQQNTYYKMMNDPSFRVAHPQAGMRVTGLVPLVRQVVVNRPIVNRTSDQYIVPFDNSSPVAGQIGTFYQNVDDDSLNTVDNQGNQGLEMMSGPLIHLPPQETRCWTEFSPELNASLRSNYAGFMKTFVGCLITPPAIQQSLYFRLQIVWHVKFSGFRPIYDTMRAPQRGANNYFDYFDRPVDPASVSVASTMEQLDTTVDFAGLESYETRNISVA